MRTPPLSFEKTSNTILEGRFLDARRRLSHNEGTPSSDEGGRSFRFTNYIVSLETNCSLIVVKYSFEI